ncbi:uncharacterized protein L969DRAFT_86824 [Mixia osmundae IAM 14324]|uniref:FAD/NAD(P)-binding domain-containing protein n=1 Tax=Mixia osmundae (strain CBS 9802 / IAM 14324 / JCM 22182 / KY 12970) TaxID=764103 RepID=G7E8U8_MIXOS|nr:uncharacterized protein L969DRAFT_86824 [Mixia osmundae IAM 14324]KEI40202.1 hypothetical protein L969DRAFT_86824 [Mixia osmundae IAM 14324]GAA99566.1 hypothetical protein E5Q_06267 [Mixia osmundae IAM 14324]
MVSAEAKQIVVVGGSYGALKLAHESIRSFAVKQPDQWHVHIISASTEFWHSIGTPRGILPAGGHTIDDSFLPLEKGFKQYKPEHYTITYGTVTSIDDNARSVHVKTQTGEQDVAYYALILSPGVLSKSPLFSYHDGSKSLRKAYEDAWQAIPKANSVLIAGGGATGTETAGEIGVRYPDKKVAIYSGAERLLPSIPAKFGSKAAQQLQRLGVEVVHTVRIKEFTKSDQGYTVHFDDGSSRSFDYVIDATGRLPNTSFIPAKALNAKKAIIVDDFFRVPALGERVYAIGDATRDAGLVALMSTAPVLIGTIKHDFGGGKAPKPYKGPMNMMLVPIGPNGGVGHAFGWNMPSFLVKQAKAKGFFWEKFEPALLGND